MIDQLYQLVNEGAKRLGNWPVVFAKQNLPRPQKPYITIDVLNVDIPDHVIYSELDDQDFVTITGWRKAQVEVQLFNGINSLTSVNTLALALQSVSVLEFQTAHDCSIGQRMFIGYVPEMLNLSQFEGRGIYQFEFFYTESLAEQGYSIGSVEVHGCYVGTASAPDPYTMFDDTCPEGGRACDEVIPDPESVETNWDDGETGWDKNQITEWDNILP